nr:hypothetical protein [uncultured Mediterranean phage uvMED]
MSIVKLNNRGVKDATAFGSITGLGSMTFIKKLTASSSSTLSFVDGASSVVLDNTYKEYLFTFKNIHPSADGSTFQFNMSIDSGSNYNVAKTSTSILVYHFESDSASGLQYDTNRDLAQGTGFQDITEQQDNDNDSSASGTLHLFNPSSTTFVKHFITDSSMVRDGAKLYATKNAGYGNTTSAVDAIRFQMSSGNIDAGDICLYGIA